MGFKKGHTLNKGKDNPNYGKITPQEVRDKIRESHLGSKPWNLGLTKETDERVKKNAENIKTSWNSKSEEEMKAVSENRSGKSSCHYGVSPTSKSIRGIGTWYFTPLQGYKWLKSSYEIAFAEYLDQHNIKWYYEPKFFPLILNNKECSYTPDFFLPEYNKFVEVKGRENYENWEDCNGKIKFEKFKQDYSFYIEILFCCELIKLGINLKYYYKNKQKKSNISEISYEYNLNLIDM
jgi:hypothetical protein